MDFPTVFDSNVEILDGTGCSASVGIFSLLTGRPFWSIRLTADLQAVAGIISLLNDYQISRGRAPLGFLNPFLYGNGIHGIFDIIGGSNPGCGTDGFLAVEGWDAVGPPNPVPLHFRR